MGYSWKPYPDLKFTVGSIPQPCQYAQSFAPWAEELVKRLGEHPSEQQLAQARLLLADHYYELRQSVPKAHRDCIRSRTHSCIFHVFERTYTQLREMGLTRFPPVLRESPPSPPAPPPAFQIPGIFLGLPEEKEK